MDDKLRARNSLLIKDIKAAIIAWEDIDLDDETERDLLEFDIEVAISRYERFKKFLKAKMQ